VTEKYHNLEVRTSAFAQTRRFLKEANRFSTKMVTGALLSSQNTELKIKNTLITQNESYKVEKLS